MPSIENSCDLHIHWVVDPSLEEEAPAVAGDERYADGPSCPQMERGWFQNLPLTDRLSVFRAVHRHKPKLSDRLLQLGEYPIGFDDSTLVVEVIDDTIEFQHGIQGENLKSDAKFFRHGDQHCAFSPLDTDYVCELAGIAITDTTSCKLLGDKVAEQLLVGLGFNPAPVEKAAPIPLRLTIAAGVDDVAQAVAP